MDLYVATHQVNGLGGRLAGFATPGLAPEPLLGEALDGDLVDHVVGEVLVQVGQGVGVLGQGLVLPTEPVPCSQLSEPQQVHHVQGGDVVASVPKVVTPVASLPESDWHIKDHSLLPKIIPFYLTLHLNV